jgi:hypothetical protein
MCISWFCNLSAEDLRAQVEHILLPADSLEKESLYKLLGRYTDCVYFYPNIPKTAIEAIRKEMEEIPGVAHYKVDPFCPRTCTCACTRTRTCTCTSASVQLRRYRTWASRRRRRRFRWTAASRRAAPSRA